MGYNIIHTNSGYVADYRLPNKEIWDTFAMDFLSGQEQKLYNMLGKNDFTSFMAEVHRLLDQAGNVRAVLARFKKGSLTTSLELPKQLTLMDQEIHIHFKKFKEFDLDKLFEQLNGINGITVDSNVGTLNFVYNQNSVKNLMNKIEKREGTRREFKTDSKSMTAANQAFKDWLAQMNSIDALGTFQINGQSTDLDFTIHTSDKAKNLFGLTQKDIERAIFENPELKERLITIRENVYKELYNLCSGVPELQQAFDNVWTQKMGSIHSTNTTALLNFIFLSKGRNLSAGVPGAIQEMYGALLAEYLDFLKNKGLPVGLVKIMGNIAEGGEQPKADLVILDDIGIQVKAYGMENKIRHMESNLHPNALDAQLMPYGAVNVGDAIVQSVFNTSNESPTSIASKLRDYGAALLNLTTSKNLGVANTVCFYLIDAQYIVPGSKIIEAFKTQQSEYDVKITSSFVGKSDSEWREEGYRPYSSYDHTVRVSPNYMEFFDKEGTDQIRAESRNKDLYTVLYTNRISIRTIFDYGFVGGDKNIYSIL